MAPLSIFSQHMDIPTSAVVIIIMCHVLYYTSFNIHSRFFDVSSIFFAFFKKMYLYTFYVLQMSPFPPIDAF